MIIAKNKKIFFSVLLTLIVLIVSVIYVLEEYIEPIGYYYPEYKKIDITTILQNQNKSEDDYKELFYQTGLGKTAIDEILKSSDGEEKIKTFQENFFRKNSVVCESIGIITSQESLVDENDNYIYGFELAPYENGYVLVTKATHSIGWRHGHAAIVTDKNNDETLEAVILGSDTMLMDINHWRVYPSFVMLKLKDTSPEKLNEIAKFAKNNLNGIPYGLTVGLTSKKNPSPEKISSTTCSHIAWYPFKQFGYDIDSDGSWLVTPNDIANSNLFEVVQVYGVDPKNIWP